MQLSMATSGVARRTRPAKLTCAPHMARCQLPPPPNKNGHFFIGRKGADPKRQIQHNHSSCAGDELELRTGTLSHYYIVSACHASASASPSGRTTSLAALGARRARLTSRRARWGCSRAGSCSRARLALRLCWRVPPQARAEERLRHVGGHRGRRASTFAYACLDV